MHMPSRRIIAIVLAGLALAFSVSWLDVVPLRHLDQAHPAIRAFISDQQYYLLRVHRLLETGRPLGGAYFDERLADAPRYLAFESVLLAAGRALVPFFGTGPVPWAVILRAWTAFGCVIGLTLLLRKWGRVTSLTAFTLAAIIFLWTYLRILYMGNSLTTWHLPFTLVGFLLATAALERPPGARRAAALLLASAPFLTHPIAFAYGTLALGLASLARAAQERARAAFVWTFVWGACVAAIGAAAYGRFAAASDAIGETLARNLHVASRLPALPLTSLWVAAFCAIAIILARRAEAKDRAAWTLVASAAVAALVGLNLNVLTGTYFLNDHFGFLLPLLVPIAGVMAFRVPAFAPTRKEKAVAALAAAVFVAWSFRLLADGRSWQEARAFAHLATVLSFAALAWKAFGRPAVAAGGRPSPAVVFALGAAGVVLPIVSAFVWLDGYRPIQVAIQKERAVIEALAGLPPGVVLSDPMHAETVAGYTPHRAYWSALAFGDDASSDELRARWSDALRVFPSRWDLIASPVGPRSLYGHMDLMCLGAWPLVREEHAPYRFLERHFGFEKSLCRPGPDEAEWTAQVDGARAAAGLAWTPRYRLDYLLIDRAEKEALPASLEPTFERLRRVGAIEVWRARPDAKP